MRLESVHKYIVSHKHTYTHTTHIYIKDVQFENLAIAVNCGLVYVILMYSYCPSWNLLCLFVSQFTIS